MDNPWIIHGYPWIIHGYQGILFVTKWHAIKVERISTRPISTIFRSASLRFFRISGFPLFIFLIFYCFSFYFGRHRRPPRISLGAAGATKHHFGGILSFNDFSRNPETMQNRFLSVSRNSFRRNSRESMRNRCPVISQPSVYSNTKFFY